MNCACGRPLHYTDPKVEAFMERMVKEHGEFIEVETPDGRWKVQRHFIALHGLHADDLPKLGFEEVRPKGANLH